MGNPMKYIRDLEAAGFERNQAEEQVQMVLDAIEGDMATKSDLTLLKNDLSLLRSEIKNDFTVFQERIQSQFKESEFRITTRLGVMIVSTVSIAVAVLTWLIKI